jgi:pyocin large subunit-like protein
MNLRLGGWSMRRLFMATLAAIAILAYWSHVAGRGERAVARESSPASETATSSAPTKGWSARIAFVNAQRLDEHYEKHGSEFGRISRQDYLRQAQLLRDASVGGPVLETVRADRVATRYDRQTGAFIAFNPDGTIRTFFKPNDGERYYRRQAERVGE